MNRSLSYKFLLVSFFITFLSCEEIIFEKDISKSEVQLVAPTNNAQFFSTGITFTWESVTDATEYRLQVAKPNFTSPMQVVLDTVILGTNFHQQLPIGEYEWRVKAINSGYSTNYTGRLFSVVSDSDFQSNIVTLNTPANNFITKISMQNLSWTPIIGATGYQMQVFDDNNTVISDQTLTSANLDYNFLEGSYSWRVRATNGNQQTLYSSRSILVDSTVPNIPVLSIPVNLSTTTNSNVSFEWTRGEIAGSTEKDSIYIYKDNALTTLHLKNEGVSPFSASLDLGTYYWFVKAFDEAGNVSDKSIVFSFTVN